MTRSEIGRGAKMKPLSGKQVNWLLFHEGEDSIEERGNVDDGYEVYRHGTECLAQADEGDED